MIVRAWSVTCRVVGALAIAGFLVAAFTPASTMAARRLAVAPDAGPAEAIVVLGVSGEAEARARLAASLGVPRAAILTEGRQPTTRAEASQMGVVLRRLGVRRLLLVTDVLHMRRARALFERAGLAVRAVPTDTWVLDATVPEKRLLVTRYVAQELAALAYHKLFGYL